MENFKIRLFFLALLMIGWSVQAQNVKTNCGIETLPCLQNFESAVVPGMPECTSVQNVAVGNNWETYNNPGFGFASKVLRYKYHSSNPANTWFYLQPVELVAGNSYRLTFRYGSNSNAYVEKLKVSYGNSSIDTAMINLIVDYPSILNTTPNISETDFTPAVSGTYYLGFNCYSDVDQFLLFVDDVFLDLTPSCLSPENIQIDSITMTSADILWTQAGSCNSWKVKVSTQPINPSVSDGDVVANQSTTDNLFKLTELESGSQYYYYVQADCGEGDLSYWSDEGVFFTDCEPFSVPFVDGFETWETGFDAFLNCWKRPLTYISGTAIFPSSNSEQFVSSPKSLKFRSEVAKPTYAVTPPFLQDIRGLMVSFSLKAENLSSSGIIEVGVMSNSSDTTTFELVQTIIPTSTSWTLYEVLFNETMLMGANNHIAFRHVSNHSDNYYCLDDVSVENIPACQKPSDLFSDNITETSAVLSWNENGLPISWNFKCSTSPINPRVDEAEIEMILSSNSFVFPEGALNSSTIYYWYLQADCGDDEVSLWAESVFSTDCVPVSIPYSENFSGVSASELPYCWTQSHTHWGVQTTSFAGGALSELSFSWSPTAIGDFKVFLSEVDARVSSNLAITFLHAVDWFSESFDLKLECTIDSGSTWSTIWQTGNVTSDMEPTYVNVNLSSFVDGEIFQLAFVFSGNSYNINYWSIDNVIISGVVLNTISQIDVNSNVADISVCKGTSESSAIAALAPQITIKGTDNAHRLVNLNWTIDAYDANTPADYNATGVFQLPIGLDQTNPVTPLEVHAVITLTNDLVPEVSCPADFTITEQNIVLLGGALPVGGTFSGIGVTEGEFNPLSLNNGEYTITYYYTDAITGCSNACEYVIAVNVVSSINVNEMTKIGVYPNPNSGMFNIGFGNMKGEVIYQIFDIKGSLITSKNIYTNGNTIEKVSLNLNSGVYFLKVYTANQFIVNKLLVR